MARSAFVFAKQVTRSAIALVAIVACGSDRTVSPPAKITHTDPASPAPTPVSYTIQLSPTSVSLSTPPGSPTSAAVTATVRNGAGELVSGAVTWVIDAPIVASVTSSGTVTAVGAGTTTLRARFGGAEATAAVTVSVPVTFVATPAMTVARTRHTATLLPDGKVLIAGGGTATAELYDPATNRFTLTGSMSEARAGHSATLLRDGTVLIAGGTNGLATSEPFGSATAELYDPATGSFTPTGSMLQPQSGHAGTLLPNGKVLITGGVAGDTDCCPIVAGPELYDPATGTFSAAGAYALTSASETNGLVNVATTLLPDGRVLMASEPASELYDPRTDAFALAGTMATQPDGEVPRYIAGRTGTLLRDGRVLLIGGEHEDLGRFATAELYDASTGAFRLTGSMSSVRDAHTATLLSDGTVLVAGGEGGCDVPSCVITSLSSAEVYDPSKGTFSPAGSMIGAREFHTATLLRDGRVLVAGGILFVGGANFSATGLATAELYVPGLAAQRAHVRARPPALSR